jgi:hypothetical protein
MLTLIPFPGGVARSAGVVTLILIENAGFSPAFIYEAEGFV